VRHPDRRQSEHFGEAIVGQRSAEVRQDRGPRAGGRHDRIHRPVHARMIGVETCRGHRLRIGLADLDLPKSAQVEVRAHRGDERAPVAADDKPYLQMRARPRRIALTGRSGLPVRNASTSSVFHPNTRSAGVMCGSPQSRRSPVRPVLPARCRRAHGEPIRESAPAAAHRRGCDPAHRPSTRWRWRDRSRVGEKPAPVSRVMRTLRAGRSRDRKLNAPRETRKIVGWSERRRGQSEAISRSADSASARSSHNWRRPGEPTSAHFDQELRVEAEPAALGNDASECREIDRVLTLVVGGAAPIPAATLLRDLPTASGPRSLLVVAGDHSPWP